jgi:hypothetical protein
MTLIEKMVTNQGWGKDRTPAKTQKGMHTMKEADMLAAKINLLLKKFDKPATNAKTGNDCPVCGNVVHSGNDCPETRKDAAYINNGFRQQGGGNNNG